MSFYNTIEETGEALKQSFKKARTQEEAIYALFLSTEEPLSPSMVLNQTGLNCPITSIRRAITNLTLDGKIEKTNDFVMGSYGKHEHLWSLAGVKE